MGTETRTAKVEPRKSETPTEKIPGGLLALVSKAKSNPWVLVALALGGGTGTQEVLAKLGQNVEWWWVAIGVAGFALLDVGTRLLRDVADIKASLREGRVVMENLKEDVKSLNGWRKEVIEAQVAAATSGKHRRKGSEGSLRTA